MKYNVTMKTFSIDVADSIPQTQGLYAFYLDLLSPAKLGLIGHGDFPESQLVSAKKQLLKRVGKSLTIARSEKLQGEIKEVNKGEHLARVYKLIADGVSNDVIVNTLSALPYEVVYEYAAMSGMLAVFAQPVYVGITKDQTLRTRYFQHNYDYESSTDTAKFGFRIKEMGLDWDDLLFGCIEFGEIPNSDIIMPLLEKQLQAISSPLFSLR